MLSHFRWHLSVGDNVIDILHLTKEDYAGLLELPALVATSVDLSTKAQHDRKS
jgi:hypothetical protein